MMVELPPSGLTRTILGHTNAEQLFLEAWNANRPHHALMLTGKEGIGKATLAYKFARFVLHETSNTGFGGGLFSSNEGQKLEASGLDIDPDSPLFNQLVEGAHSDFRMVQPLEDKTQITIEQIRELLRFSTKTAGSGGWKVILIDALDDLTLPAANALLKLLEEPPAKTLLLLTAHRPGNLLPTLRSRCLKLALSPLDDGVMSQLIDHHFPDTNLNKTDIIKLAEGSFGFATRMIMLEGGLLYNMMLNLLSDPTDNNFNNRVALAKRISGAQKKMQFKLLAELLEGWGIEATKRLIMQRNGGDMPAFNSELEQLAFERQTQATTPASFAEKVSARALLCAQAYPPANLEPTHLIHRLFQ